MTREKSRFTVPIILGLIVVCCACAGGVISLLYFYREALFSRSGPVDSSEPVVSTPIATPQPDDSTPTPEPENASLPEWTVIVYSAADDIGLEEVMLFDVNEMELVGSNPQMNIVVQLDRYAGAFEGDGDWTEARRYLITQDSDMYSIASPVLENLGEVDMADPQTFVDFVTWAVQNYPAQKYALVISDHGGGWQGVVWDLSSSTDWAHLSLPQIAAALEQVQQNTDIDRFEVIVFDACLMAQIEVFGSLYSYSNYMLASEDLVPGISFSHAAWLGLVAQEPEMDGGELSQAIMTTYIADDKWAENFYTPEMIAHEEAIATLSVVESARVPDVIGAMNQFISALAAVDQMDVAEARTYARNYYSDYAPFASAFIDLGNFSEIIAYQTGDPVLQKAAAQLQTAISSAVIAEKHGASRSGSNGIAFHFPDSDLYSSTELSNGTVQSYAEASSLFLEQSYWDEFLAFHYTGVAFAPQDGIAFAPSRTAVIFAPGASELTIGALDISDTEISGDETVTVSTTVEGNVAYIYTALYFWDANTNSYWIGDISYYYAENTITIDGVNSPDYGGSPVQVQYEWSPTLYILTDGEHEAFALFEPLEYLSAEEQTVYGLHGQYSDALSNTPVDALLSFDANGNFLYAYAFPDPAEGAVSTPVQIIPKAGDHFTDYVQYITYDANDNPTYNSVLSGDVFTWGEPGFSFHSSYPVDGQYAVVVMAYDFDNNFVWNYEFVTYQR